MDAWKCTFNWMNVVDALDWHCKVMRIALKPVLHSFYISNFACGPYGLISLFYWEPCLQFHYCIFMYKVPIFPVKTVEQNCQKYRGKSELKRAMKGNECRVQLKFSVCSPRAIQYLRQEWVNKIEFECCFMQNFLVFTRYKAAVSNRISLPK